MADAQPICMPTYTEALSQRLVLLFLVILARKIALLIFSFFYGLDNRMVWFFEWLVWPVCIALVLAFLIDTFSMVNSDLYAMVILAIAEARDLR